VRLLGSVWHTTSFLTVGNGCCSSHTCCGSSCTPSGRLYCTMVEAPVQVQQICSCSCNACVSHDEVAVCCQPHGQTVPRFMGQPWPPAPTTPCWSRRHQTSVPIYSPMGPIREPPYLAYSRWERFCCGQGFGGSL